MSIITIHKRQLVLTLAFLLQLVRFNCIPSFPSISPFCSRRPTISTLDAHQNSDYYALLSVSPSASPTEVKNAYHRALLRYHPDKQVSRQPTAPHLPHGDIGSLKIAYETLAAPESRARYDALRAAKASAPRPAQVVSLEEFTELEDAFAWTYACRCSGAYIITEQDMERGQHLVGCNSCSEVVSVGFELAEDEDTAGGAVLTNTWHV